MAEPLKGSPPTRELASAAGEQTPWRPSGLERTYEVCRSGWREGSSDPATPRNEGTVKGAYSQSESWHPRDMLLWAVKASPPLPEEAEPYNGSPSRLKNQIN